MESTHLGNLDLRNDLAKASDRTFFLPCATVPTDVRGDALQYHSHGPRSHFLGRKKMREQRPFLRTLDHTKVSPSPVVCSFTPDSIWYQKTMEYIGAP